MSRDLDTAVARFGGAASPYLLRPFRDKFAERASILDFSGVYRDGSTQCGEAINAAIEEIKDNSVAGIKVPIVLDFPEGIYRHADPIKLYSRVLINGRGPQATRFSRVAGGEAGPSITNVHAGNSGYASDILFGVRGVLIDGHAATMPAESFASSFLATDYGGVRLECSKSGSTITAGNSDLELTDARMILDNVFVWDVAGTGVYMAGAGGSFIQNIWTQRTRRWGVYLDVNDCKITNIDCAASDWGAITIDGSNNEVAVTKGWFSGRNFSQWENAYDYLAALESADADGWQAADADRHFNNRYAGAGMICRGSYNRLIGCNVQDTAGHGIVVHGEGIIGRALTGDQVGQISGWDANGGNVNFKLLTGNTKTYGFYTKLNTYGDIEYHGVDRLHTGGGYVKRVNAHAYVDDATCALRVGGEKSLTIDDRVVERGFNAPNMGMVINGHVVYPKADPMIAGALWMNNGVLTESAGTTL